MNELIPACPLEREHNVLIDHDKCWSCDVLVTLWRIATNRAIDPSTESQLALDENVLWRRQDITAAGR